MPTRLRSIHYGCDANRTRFSSSPSQLSSPLGAHLCLRSPAQKGQFSINIGRAVLNFPAGVKLSASTQTDPRYR